MCELLSVCIFCGEHIWGATTTESTQKCFTFFIYFRKVQLNLMRPGSTYGSHLTISLIFSLFFELNVLCFNSTVSILSTCCIILHTRKFQFSLGVPFWNRKPHFWREYLIKDLQVKTYGRPTKVKIFFSKLINIAMHGHVKYLDKVCTSNILTKCVLLVRSFNYLWWNREIGL